MSVFRAPYQDGSRPGKYQEIRYLTWYPVMTLPYWCACVLKAKSVMGARTSQFMSLWVTAVRAGITPKLRNSSMMPAVLWGLRTESKEKQAKFCS